MLGGRICSGGWTPRARASPRKNRWARSIIRATASDSVSARPSAAPPRQSISFHRASSSSTASSRRPVVISGSSPSRPRPRERSTSSDTQPDKASRSASATQTPRRRGPRRIAAGAAAPPTPSTPCARSTTASPASSVSCSMTITLRGADLRWRPRRPRTGAPLPQDQGHGPRHPHHDGHVRDRDARRHLHARRPRSRGRQWTLPLRRRPRRVSADAGPRRATSLDTQA